MVEAASVKDDVEDCLLDEAELEDIEDDELKDKNDPGLIFDSQKLITSFWSQACRIDLKNVFIALVLDAELQSKFWLNL